MSEGTHTHTHVHTHAHTHTHRERETEGGRDMTHGGVCLLLMPGCVQEAGSGTLSPRPDQVGLPEGGAEEDGDPP